MTNTSNPKAALFIGLLLLTVPIVATSVVPEASAAANDWHMSSNVRTGINCSWNLTNPLNGSLDCN